MYSAILYTVISVNSSPHAANNPSVGRQPTESNMGQTKKFKIQS